MLLSRTPSNVPKYIKSSGALHRNFFIQIRKKAAKAAFFICKLHQSQLSAREMPPSMPQASGISLIRMLISILFSPVISASLSVSAVMMAFFAA